MSSKIMEKMVGKVENGGSKNIFANLQIKGDGEQKFNTGIRVATDTGVGRTILNRTDWFKIADECRLIKTKIKFRPWSTDQKLPVRGRAKVQCNELGDGEGSHKKGPRDEDATRRYSSRTMQKCPHRVHQDF